MKTHDFYYDLPEELIAQDPLEKRDHSRMLVLDRRTGGMEDRHFFDLADYLKPGDCLILNDSRVLPARLYGQRKGTGAAVELLLLSQKGQDTWEVLAGPGRKAGPGIPWCSETAGWRPTCWRSWREETDWSGSGMRAISILCWKRSAKCRCHIISPTS